MYLVSGACYWVGATGCLRLRTRYMVTQTADQSGCWENGFSADFLEYLYFIPEMKPISNIAYQIQYLTIFFILDLQENIYKKVKKTYYMLAGSASQHVVVFWDLNIDIVLEVQNRKYNQILYLIDYIVYGPQFPHTCWKFPNSVKNLCRY